MEWSATIPQSAEGSTSLAPSLSTTALPLSSTQSCPKYSLFIVQDSKTKDLECYGFQIAENTNETVNNIEVPRSLPEGFIPFTDEPFHRNSNNIPILKPNFICAEEDGRHCSVTSMNLNFYRIPGQTKSSVIQLRGSNLFYVHSLNPNVPIIKRTMPINVEDSHSIILDDNLYCFGGCLPSNWACSMNTKTGQWISIPNPPYRPPDMSSVFSVSVKNYIPYIVVGFKDSQWRLQLLNVVTKEWLIGVFQPKLNDQILDPPTNQPVGVDSKFFWYDPVKHRVVGYDLFFDKCYFAEVHTHDHGAGDSQPHLAFISGCDDGSLCFCLQWLSQTKIDEIPMVKFHCLKFLLAQNQPPFGSTIFLDCRVLACQTFLVWGRKSFLDTMVGNGRLNYPYLSHEFQLEN